MDGPTQPPVPAPQGPASKMKGMPIGRHTRKSLYADEGGREEKSKLESEKIA